MLLQSCQHPGGKWPRPLNTISVGRRRAVGACGPVKPLEERWSQLRSRFSSCRASPRLCPSFHLWGWRAGSILRKAFWTVLVWTPLLGPLFYLTMYRIPKEKDELHKGMGAETHSAG